MAALLAPPVGALQVGDAVKISEVHYDPGEMPESSYEFVELYNSGSTTVFLDGAVITDQGNSGSSESTFQFQGTPLTGNSIPLAPGAFMLLVESSDGCPYVGADFEFYGGSGDTDDPSVPNLVKTSGLATDLSLANGGDGVTLSVGLSNGNFIPCAEIVDGVSWEDGGGQSEVTAMSSEVCSDPSPHAGEPNGSSSLQRRADGNDSNSSAADFAVAPRTPKAAHSCELDLMCVTDLRHSPCVPGNAQPVTVSLFVTDPLDAAPVVRLFYKLESAATYDSLEMAAVDDSLRRATLPGQVNLSRVQLWVRALDLLGNSVRFPAGAPATTWDYRVGYFHITTIQGYTLPDSCHSSSLVGKSVNTRGVVTHRALEFDKYYFYMQNGVGPNSGVRVVVPDGAFVPNLGDSVAVSGSVRERDCQTEIVVSPGCVTVLRTGRKVHARQLATAGDVSLEVNEGMLVTVFAPLDVLSDFQVNGVDREFQIRGGAQTGWVGGDTFTPDGIGYGYVPAPGQRLDSVTGIVAARPRTPVDPSTPLRLEPRRDYDVDLEITDAPDDSVQTSLPFLLRQNQPNPLRFSTAIEFAVRRAGRVRLSIYDARGTLVRVLAVRDYARPTRDRVIWDGTDARGRHVASGLYIYKLETGRETASRKMLLLD